MIGDVAVARDQFGDSSIAALTATAGWQRLAAAAAQRYGDIFELLPDATLITEQAGSIVFINRRAEQLFGYGHGALLGQPIEALISTRLRSIHAQHRWHFNLAPDPREMGHGRELVALRQDGSEFPAEISLSPVQCEEGPLVVAAIRDITKRRRSRVFAAEHRALATAERLAAQREAVLNQIVDGVVICDAAGRITYVNQTAQRLGAMADLGSLVSDHRRVAHLRTTEGEPVQPQDLPLVRAGRGEVVVGYELVFEQADGKEVVVRCSAAPVRTSDGSMLGAVLVLYDVTAWRDLGRQKDEFFANASHDLRTPLATISAAIELVLANEPPGTPDLVHRLLLNIDGATHRMSRLVEDLLELTRLQGGRAHLHLDRCDVRVLIMNTVRAIEPLTRARGQHLQCNLPPAALWITADAERLERALFNLLDNAHKYTPPGGRIALTVQAQHSTVVISVTDDGPGIPMDEQKYIFERFYRPERTERSTGTGLGLPIVRAVAELHGGRLWVESKPGMGSTFFVALPATPPVVTLPQGRQA